MCTELYIGQSGSVLNVDTVGLTCKSGISMDGFLMKTIITVNILFSFLCATGSQCGVLGPPGVLEGVPPAKLVT